MLLTLDLATNKIEAECDCLGKWMTQGQLVDGLALTGSLPAPFIIVTTFCGFLALGFIGSFVITLGTFLPAFIIPMYGHNFLDKMSEKANVRIIDGITAGAARLIVAEVLDILRQVLVDMYSVGIFLASLVLLFTYRSSYVIIWIILGGAIMGILMGK